MTYPDWHKEHPNSVYVPDGWKVEYLSMRNIKPYDWDFEEDFASYDKIISYKLYKECRDQGFCAEEYEDKLGKMKLCMRNEHQGSHGIRIN